MRVAVMVHPWSFAKRLFIHSDGKPVTGHPGMEDLRNVDGASAHFSSITQKCTLNKDRVLLASILALNCQALRH